jgi:endonuclease/exonuclease/phosphatase family metal-dependent hydrolase
MKIVFLNTWDAKLLSALTDFISQQAQDTDIFCLQEVYDSARSLCADILPGYSEFFGYKFVAENDQPSQATYVKNNIEVVSSGKLFEGQSNTGLAVFVQLRIGMKDLYVCNFHGLSRPIDKLDSPGRLLQSQSLINHFASISGDVIIGGDFNAFPETKSITMLENSGFKNLIKDYDIKNTRNRFVWDRYPDHEKQYYSDYVFVSQNVVVKSFSVPNIEVSDHLPLIMTIEEH